MIGVADGVGGWRQYGVDPGQFSTHLMKTCERLVRAGYFISNQPARLLAHGFREMQVEFSLWLILDLSLELLRIVLRQNF